MPTAVAPTLSCRKPELWAPRLPEPGTPELRYLPGPQEQSLEMRSEPPLSEEANFQLYEQVLQAAGQIMPSQTLLGMHGARHCGSAKHK